MGSDPTRQPIYQPVEYCTYLTVLGSFNKLNMNQFTNKTTTKEDFDAVHKVVLYGISDNIFALVQKGKYGAINNSYPTTMGYYVVGLLSEPYVTRQQNSSQASHKVRRTYRKNGIYYYT